MNKPTPFFKRLKSLRIAAGINQIQFAKLSGYSQASISQLEKGQRLPSPEIITKFASILSVTENKLTGERIDYEYNRLVRNSRSLSQESLKKLNEFVDLFRQAEHGKKKRPL